MKTTTKATGCKYFKTRADQAGGLLAIGILVAAFIMASDQSWGAAASAAKIVTYPAPTGEVLSANYEVHAAGQKVDAYMARVLDPPFAGKQWDYGGSYSFANFDMSGPVVVRIVSKRSLQNVVIRPLS